MPVPSQIRGCFAVLLLCAASALGAAKDARLLVGHFTVDDPQLRWLATAVQEDVGAALLRLSKRDVIRPRTLNLSRFIPDDAVARETASTEIWQGRISGDAQRATLHVIIRDAASGAVRAETTIAGPPLELQQPLLGAVVELLRRDGITPADPAMLKPMRAAGEAWRLRGLALRVLEFHPGRQWPALDESTQFLERAVEIDPKYAAAWRMLAVAYGEDTQKVIEADHARQRVRDLDPYDIDSLLFDIGDNDSQLQRAEAINPEYTETLLHEVYFRGEWPDEPKFRTLACEIDSVRRKIVEDLTGLPVPLPLSDLVSLITSGSDCREEAVASLEVLGRDEYRATIRGPISIPDPQPLLRSADPLQRRAALALLRIAGTPPPAEALRAALTDHDPRIRYDAVWLAGSDPAWNDVVAELAHDDAELVRSAAATILRRRSPIAADAILDGDIAELCVTPGAARNASLGSANAAERRHALWEIGRRHESDKIATVAQFEHSADPATSRVATATLAVLGDRDGLRRFLMMLTDPDAERQAFARRMLIRVISSLPEKPQAEQLIDIPPMLKEEVNCLGYETQKAFAVILAAHPHLRNEDLSLLNDAEALAILADVAESGDDRDRKAAASALCDVLKFSYSGGEDNPSPFNPWFIAPRAVRASGITERLARNPDLLPRCRYALDYAHVAVARTYVDEGNRAAIEESLRDESPLIRTTVVQEIGARRAAQFLPLVNAAAHDESSTVRQAAYDALLNFDDRRVIRGLEAFLDDPHFGLSAAEDLARWRIGSAIAPLMQATTSPDEQERARAFAGLRYIAPPEAAAALLRGLCDPSKLVRYLAALAYWNRDLALPVDELKSLFAELRADDREEMLEAWIRRDRPDVIPLLIVAASDASSEVRMRAAEALGRFGQIPALLTLTHDPQTPVRHAAIRALFDFSFDSRVADRAVDLLSDEEDVAGAASSILHFNLPASLRDRVRALLHGSDRVLRARAAGVLGADKTAMLEALRGDPDVRAAAAASVAWRALDGAPTDPDMVDALLTTLREAVAKKQDGVAQRVLAALRLMHRQPPAELVGAIEKEPSLRLSAAALIRFSKSEPRQALAEHAFETPNAFTRSRVAWQLGAGNPLLRKALDDPDASVRTAAAKRLGEVHDVDAAGLLREHLNHDHDIDTRIAAAVALSNLGDPAGVRGLLEIIRTDRQNAWGAALALHRIHDPGALPALIDLAKSRGTVDRIVVEELASFRTPQAVAAAYDLLLDQRSADVLYAIRRELVFPPDAETIRRAGDAFTPGAGAYLLALAARETNAYDLQLQHASDAVATIDAHHEPGLLILAMQVKAHAEIKTGHPATALETLQRADALDRTLWPAEKESWGEPLAEWTAYWRCVAYEALGGDANRQKAVAAYQELIASVRGNDSAQKIATLAQTNLGAVQLQLGRENLQNALDRGRDHPTADSIEFENEQKRYIELARQKIANDGDYEAAQALLEELNLRRTKYLMRNRSFSFADPGQAAMLAEYRQRVEAIEQLERRTKQKTRGSADDESNQQQELAQQRRALQTYVTALKKTHPDLAALLGAQPIELSRVQSQLPADVAILQYLVLPEKVVTFVIRHGRIDYVESAAGSDALRTAVEEFRAAIFRGRGTATRGVKVDHHGASGDEAGKRLYDALVAPARKAKLLDGVAVLGIAPNAFLHLLPFAAIPSGASYLGDDFAIFYVNSTSSLWVAHDRRPHDDAGVQAILAISNPDGSLAAASREVTMISNGFEKRRVLPGKEATKQATLLSLQEKPRYLHFATHGVLDGADSTKNYLVLADGRLNVDEVWGLPLEGVSLATLSACDTALGERLSGDEIVSLENAFFYAGASSVVATLWSVDDDSTADLMIAFYRHLHEHQPKAIALAMAQRDVRKKYAAPFYWAAFTVHGDWQ